MGQARYELIGSAVSPFVRKVRACLALKSIPYDLTEISIFAPPEWFETISPLKRIPVLRDHHRNGATLNDSSVIVAYLEAEHTEIPLYPQDPWDRARALWFEEYMDSDFAFRMGMGVFRPRYVSPRMGKPVDEALAQKTLTEHAPRFYRYLNDAIAGKPWFVGDRLSIADIAVATQFANLRYANETPSPQDYPDLAAYVEKMLATPVFASLAALERAAS
ncbi:MAG: glutathione S-transferase family protein [Caulobacterales bacterium]|jgi:glutathione S-transferase